MILKLPARLCLPNSIAMVKKKYEMLKDNTCNTTLETEWYVNGQKKTEIPYKNGLRDGIAYSWDPQGKVIRKVTWNSGNE